MSLRTEVLEVGLALARLVAAPLAAVRVVLVQAPAPFEQVVAVRGVDHVAEVAVAARLLRPVRDHRLVLGPLEAHQVAVGLALDLAAALVLLVLADDGVAVLHQVHLAVLRREVDAGEGAVLGHRACDERGGCRRRNRPEPNHHDAKLPTRCACVSPSDKGAPYHSREPSRAGAIVERERSNAARAPAQDEFGDEGVQKRVLVAAEQRQRIPELGGHAPQQPDPGPARGRRRLGRAAAGSGSRADTQRAASI